MENDTLARQSANSGTEAIVTGPIGGGRFDRPFMASAVNLDDYGYVEEEYFIEGHASGYGPSPGGILTTDGRWTVEQTASLPYKTRFLVRRPADPGRFSGTLLVEWLMSIAGFDVEPSWHWHHAEYLRAGHIWVGISPKHLSVDGSAGNARFPHLQAGNANRMASFKSLTEWDPVRYGTLRIPAEPDGGPQVMPEAGRPVPGIELAFDIFSQATKAVVPARGVQAGGPLKGYDVARVLAIGTTDGAAHLITYYNGVQPLTGLFDGYFLESRGVGNFRTGIMPFGRDIPMPDVVQFRTDLPIPVILVNQDYNVPFHHPYWQPDNDYYRLWEVAGTAHMNDAFNNVLAAEIERDLGSTPESICGENRNIVPFEYPGNAALRHLIAWVDGGAAPPSFAPVSVNGTPPAIDRDEFGNTIGGLRLPHLTVPAACHLTTNTGCNGTRYESGPGSSIPFTAEQMRALYGTPEGYLAQFATAVSEAEAAGILVPEDARILAAEGVQAPAF